MEREQIGLARVVLGDVPASSTRPSGTTGCRSDSAGRRGCRCSARSGSTGRGSRTSRRGAATDRAAIAVSACRPCRIDRSPARTRSKSRPASRRRGTTLRDSAADRSVERVWSQPPWCRIAVPIACERHRRPRVTELVGAAGVGLDAEHAIAAELVALERWMVAVPSEVRPDRETRVEAPEPERGAQSMVLATT